MSRPLRGQREVFRRLQERNEARREQVEAVHGRYSGPESESSMIIRSEQEHAAYTQNMMYTGNELEEFLSSSPTSPQSIDMERLLRERREADTITFEIGGNTISRNRITMQDWANMTNEYRSLGLGIQSAAYSYLSQAPVMYLDTEAGLPAGRIVTLAGTSNRGRSRMYTPESLNNIHLHSEASMWDGVEETIEDTIGKDISCNLGSEPMGFSEGLKDYMAYLSGRITHAEYQKRDKIRTIKEKENANNKDFKVLLEADY